MTSPAHVAVHELKGQGRGLYDNSRSLLKIMSIESMMPSNHLILCHPLLLPLVFLSFGAFNALAIHIRWPKHWSFSISPPNEYSGLSFFRMDWLDLLVVQGTLKSLLQHHSSKASVLLVLSLLYGPTLTSICDYWRRLGVISVKKKKKRPI